MNFVEELRWRGMLHDIMPGTEEELQKKMTSGYIGFDPTADSLHVGHLTQIMTLIHFQRAGHKPFALVGGATGMVGDPSGKSAERNLLSEEMIRKLKMNNTILPYLSFIKSNTNYDKVYSLPIRYYFSYYTVDIHAGPIAGNTNQYKKQEYRL